MVFALEGRFDPLADEHWQMNNLPNKEVLYVLPYGLLLWCGTGTLTAPSTTASCIGCRHP